MAWLRAATGGCGLLLWAEQNCGLFSWRVIAAYDPTTCTAGNRPAGWPPQLAQLSANRDFEAILTDRPEKDGVERPLASASPAPDRRPVQAPTYRRLPVLAEDPATTEATVRDRDHLPSLTPWRREDWPRPTRKPRRALWPPGSAARQKPLAITLDPLDALLAVLHRRPSPPFRILRFRRQGDWAAIRPPVPGAARLRGCGPAFPSLRHQGAGPGWPRMSDRGLDGAGGGSTRQRSADRGSSASVRVDCRKAERRLVRRRWCRELAYLDLGATRSIRPGFTCKPASATVPQLSGASSTISRCSGPGPRRPPSKTIAHRRHRRRGPWRGIGTCGR